MSWSQPVATDIDAWSDPMNPPSTTAELLIEQFAPAVLLTIKPVSQITGAGRADDP